MSHLTAEQLSAFLDGALSADERRLVEAHVATCAGCRAALADLGAADAGLGRALAHDPGEAYFESFAARVAARIEAEGGAAPAAAPAAPRAEAAPRPRREVLPWYDIASWFRTPQRLAWAGGAAAVVVTAGVVLMLARESGVPDLRDASLARRGAQTAPGVAADLREAPESPEGAAGSAAPPAAAFRADAPESQAEGGRGLPPARAREMRRLPGGEDVPVGGARAPGFAAPPESEAAPPEAGGTKLVQRPRRVAPLESKELGAPAAKEEASAGAPAAPGTNAQSDAVAKSAPAPPVPAGDAARAGLARDLHDTRAGRIAPAPALDAAGAACGTVVDPRGRAVARAQVVLADRGVTATTGEDGGFCFGVAAGEYDISVFAVGYEPMRRTIRLGASAADARLTVRTVEVLPPPADRSAYSFSNPPPAPPDTLHALRAQAERLTAQAERDRSAAGFDVAALAWEEVVRRTPRGTEEIGARDRLASARFAAWERAPSGERAAAARAALQAFLSRAPAGARRDWARAALAQLQP